MFRRTVIAASLACLMGTSAQAAEALKPIRIILVGDSTMTDKSGYGKGFCAQFKPEAVTCVNAARGGHQREADIVRALGDGTLGAASLDVFETEPLPGSSPLWDIETCYITPHVAAISNEKSGVAYFTKIIRAHEAGEPLVNVVDRDRGY